MNDIEIYGMKVNDIKDVREVLTVLWAIQEKQDELVRLQGEVAGELKEKVNDFTTLLSKLNETISLIDEINDNLNKFRDGLITVNDNIVNTYKEVTKTYSEVYEIKAKLDDIRDTASSFSRAFVVEVMGRECGYLALISALTSGAEMCLIPEIKYNLKNLELRLKKEKEQGRDYFLAIVAEGVKKTQYIKKWFEKRIKVETRLSILGHIQRGGSPSVFERLMAYEFVNFALTSQKNGIVVYKNSKFKVISFYKETNRYVLDKHKLNLAKKLMGLSTIEL